MTPYRLSCKPVNSQMQKYPTGFGWASAEKSQTDYPETGAHFKKGRYSTSNHLAAATAVGAAATLGIRGLPGGSLMRYGPCNEARIRAAGISIHAHAHDQKSLRCWEADLAAAMVAGAAAAVGLSGVPSQQEPWCGTDSRMRHAGLAPLLGDLIR